MEKNSGGRNDSRRQGKSVDRSQRQREKILKVSGRLFWQKGYLGTSVDDMAKAANINKASIYYYFNNKTHVLYQIAVKMMDELFSVTLPISNSELPTEEKLKELINAHLKVEMSNPVLAGIAQQERKNLTPALARSFIEIRDRYEGIFYRVISEILAKGKSPIKDAKLTTRFILGMLNSVAQWYKSTGKLTQDEIAAQAAVFILQAISIPQETKEIRDISGKI